MKTLLALALAALLCSLAGVAAGQAPSRPTIFQMTPLDLGRVRSDLRAEQSLPLPNRTDSALRIINVRLVGEGIRAKVPASVPPGETATVEVVIEPANLVGDWEWGIEIETDDPRQKLLRYIIQASVYPPIEFLPSRSVFFSVYDDESLTKRLTVRNHSDTPFAIRGVERSADFFNVKLVAAEGKEMAVEITVLDSAPLGRHRETLTLLTDDPERPRMRVSVNILVKPDVYLSLDTLDFGEISIRSLKANPGSLPLLTQTFIVTRRAGEMRITGLDSDIAFLRPQLDPEGAAKAFRVDVGLDPDALEPGAYRGRLVLHTDDEAFPQLILPVRARITE